MANMLISGAINIGVGLLLNYLFAPKQPDVVQEGPRLQDLSVSSSTYGQAIPINEGTIRLPGNVIWSPGIREVAHSETQEAGGPFKGGGGGGSVTTNTYTYFVHLAIAFGEGVAEDVLKMWADGKLIYDKTGNSPLAISKVPTFRFYPGNEEQMPDPLIESFVGEGLTPAYRGLCYIVFEDLPLADFGNRIPNITAEISYKVQRTSPFNTLVELPGSNIPGSASGADISSHMFIHPFTDELYMLKGGSGGVSRSSVADMSMIILRDGTGLSPIGMNYGGNDHIYMQLDEANYSGYRKIEPNGMQQVAQLAGSGSLGSVTDPFTFSNPTSIGVISVGFPEAGIEPVDIIVVSFRSILGNGGMALYQDNRDGTFRHILTDLTVDIGRGGPVIQDLKNKRIFFTQESDALTELYEVIVEFNQDGLLGPEVTFPKVEKRGSYAKGGVDLAGTSDIDGWCVLPEENALILSNGLSMIKVDMSEGNILAKNLTLGFLSWNNWSNNGMFAFPNGFTGNTVGGGFIHIIRTADLTLLKSQSLTGVFPDNRESCYPRAAYDPRNHSIIFSRVHASDVSENRVVRLLLDRATGLGTPLSDVVARICRRVGLSDDEFDVTDLVDETVLGFSITRQGSARVALESLMRAHLFEGAESDWKIKFVRRGKEPVLTLDPNYVGRIGTDAREEWVKEIRTQEVELPERFNIRYIDKLSDYQQGLQFDRRILLPTPAMHSRSEVTLELPEVFEPTTAKQLAQRWLYISWAERARFESGMAWKYLRLDPTDVVILPYQGDLRRLRMARMEIGADFSVEFNATQEDARANESDLVGDGGSGHIPQEIPSGFPTKLHLMDLPLLTAADSGLGEFSRGYFAAAGWDGTWPGALLFTSLDNGQTFVEIGSAALECAWGNIIGAIPDPENTVTWDESATITVMVRRGANRFVNSTDLEVLNGANAIAVLGLNGPEIIQFVNATQTGPNTFQLTRLLRGRRGTDTPDLTNNHLTGETFVLLEPGRIYRFQIPLDRLNKSLQWRGVTLNTMIEDAPTTFQTFTGQDLVPYAPANLRATRSPDLVVSWDRRTRFNGELRDGTGDVPLNEAEEKYDYEMEFNGKIIKSGTVTSPTVTLPLSEWTGALQKESGETPMPNADFEESAAWVLNGASYTTSVTEGVTLTPQRGTRFLYMGESNLDTTTAVQTYDLTANGYKPDELDALTPEIVLKFYSAEVRAAQTEFVRVTLEILSDTDVVLALKDTGNVHPGVDDAWVEQVFNFGTWPLGGRKIRITLMGFRAGFGLDTPETCFDNVRLMLGTGIPPIKVRVWQVSEEVGRGRMAEAWV